MLLVAAPVLLLVALAITVTDRGPVFYGQERIGRDGKAFRIWKFRSMYVGADAQVEELAEQNEKDAVLFKIRRDPRVTPVGRWLRRLSVDEVPQLWNVVRATCPSSARGRRCRARSRSTGTTPPPAAREARRDRPLAGVGAQRPVVEESVRLDLHYVENWSVAMDAMILWKTSARSSADGARTDVRVVFAQQLLDDEGVRRRRARRLPGAAPVRRGRPRAGRLGRRGGAVLLALGCAGEAAEVRPRRPGAGGVRRPRAPPGVQRRAELPRPARLPPRGAAAPPGRSSPSCTVPRRTARTAWQLKGTTA